MIESKFRQAASLSYIIQIYSVNLRKYCSMSKFAAASKKRERSVDEQHFLGNTFVCHLQVLWYAERFYDTCFTSCH